MKLRLTLLLGLIAVVAFAENVVITNPQTQPVTMRVVGFAKGPTPAGSPVGTATPTATATATTPPPLVDGNPVSTWLDSSTGGHTATQTGTARPTFKTNIVNGKPVVRFVGANSQCLNLPAISGASPWTIYLVANPTAAFSMLGLAAGTSGGPLGPWIWDSGSGGTYLATRSAYYSFQFAGSAGWHIYTGIGDTLMSLWRDGGSVGSNAGNPITPTTIDFDSIGRTAATFADGDIAEVIMYSGGLALRTKLVLLLTTLLTTGELPPQAQLDAMAGHRGKIKQYLVQHGAHPTKAQLDEVVTPMTVGDRANVEKYLGTKYGISVPGGTAVQPDTVAGLLGWWKADSLGP